MDSRSPLPCYTSSAPPPCYSVDLNEGEEVLASTRVYQTPTGVFTARCLSAGLTVIVKEQKEDIELPLYHQRGLISGTFTHKNTENFLQVLFKVEGKLKLSVHGQNSVSTSIKILDQSYELWSKKRDGGKCPNDIDFASVLPSTFKDRDKAFSLPPSHKISLPGIPGLYTECSYVMKLVMIVQRNSLWNKTRSFCIPFKYIPRERPSMPLFSYPEAQSSECGLFLETYKCAPEAWFEKVSTLQSRPSFGLAPIEVQFFVPSELKFGLADTVPFHIQLTGSVSSLQGLYSRLVTEQVDEVTSAIPLNSPPGPAGDLKRNSKRFISLSVTLNRQVRVDVKDQVVWKSFVIGEARVYPNPPSFRPDISNSGDFTSSSVRDADNVGVLDGSGTIRCTPEVEHGSFDVGRIQIQDFLVFQIAPINSSDSSRSPFFPLKIAVPIFLVHESWSETMIN